jgi:hypothetical protein
MDDDEVFNLQSEERAALLVELNEAFGRNAVKAPLWACLQVCDLTKLRHLVITARTSPDVFAVLTESCLSIPLRWMQRPPQQKSSQASSNASTAQTSRSRSERIKRLPRERDLYRCVLTKLGFTKLPTSTRIP